MKPRITLALDVLNAAVQSIMSHGLRSVLTSLGIVIGVAAVIVIVSVMETLASKITVQLDDLASDSVTLQAYTSQEEMMLGIENGLSIDDFASLNNKVTGVQDMTKVMRGTGFLSDVTFGRENTMTRVFGTDSSYDRILSVFPLYGRFMNETDDLRRRRVAFVGATVVKDLHLPKNPVGEFISISGDWFRIIGVAEPRGKLFGLDQDNYIITPFSTMQSLHGEDALKSVAFMFRPEPGADLEDIKARMSAILRKQHNLSADMSDDFEFVTSEKIKSSFDSIKNNVSLVAIAVVGVSLLVGGIGVMNIMLVSVSERTREIGVAKAIGATQEVILFQFLLEAILLSAAGGICGVILGYLTIVLAEMLFAANIIIPIWSVVLSVAFTSLVGVLFGLAPAMKAAKLKPIDALRFE